MEQLANNPVTALNGSINSSVTSLVVDSAATFSSTPPFTIKIETELLRVTGISGTTFTVSRGQESTTATSHADDSVVTQVVTKNVMNQLFSEQCQIGGYSSRPATARAGTIYQANDIDLSWRYDGTQWNLHQPVFIDYTHRINTSGWTNLNFGTNVWTDINGTTICEQVTGEYGVVGKYHTLPSAPFSAVVCLGNAATTSTEMIQGIMLYNSGTGTFVTYGLHSIVDRYFGVQNWNNTGSPNGSGFFVTTGQRTAAFLKFNDDNTNWNFSFSHDGIDWIRIHQQTRNTFVTPTNIGLVTKRNSVLSATSLFSHFLGYWEF